MLTLLAPLLSVPVSQSRTLVPSKHLQQRIRRGLLAAATHERQVFVYALIGEWQSEDGKFVLSRASLDSCLWPSGRQWRHSPPWPRACDVLGQSPLFSRAPTDGKKDAVRR